QEAATAAADLAKTKERYEKLSFDLFPEDNLLTAWLLSNHSAELDALKKTLAEHEKLADRVVEDITAKKAFEDPSLQISVAVHAALTEKIDTAIRMLEEGTEKAELTKFFAAKTLLEHREKFNAHYETLENFVK